jgi:predicted nucleic acid-binding protein
MFLLDPSAISGLMRGDARFRELLISLPAGAPAITCTMVVGEILFGLARLPDGHRRTALERKACGTAIGVLKSFQQRLGYARENDRLEFQRVPTLDVLVPRQVKAVRSDSSALEL